MARVKTFVNGGNLLPSDLDAIEDDYECAFSTYKQLLDVSVRLDSPAAGTYVLLPGYTGAGASAAGASGALAVCYLDPARYWSVASTSEVNARSVQYDLAVSAATNNTAPGAVTLTAGLYQVSGTTGTGAAQVGVTLSGAPISGSTVAISNPAASSLLAAAHSGDFTAPAAGSYALAVVVSAAVAASSSIALRARLSMRQV